MRNALATSTEALRRQIADMQGKAVKQRQEIARLMRQVEQLQADKAGLRFDLTKAKARIAQMEAQ